MIVNISGYDVLIDDEDYPLFLVGASWNALGTRGPYFACIVKGYHKPVYLHRLLAHAPDGMQVDHINMDTLDNRKANLRICTQAENRRNLKKQNGNFTSKYKGVKKAHTPGDHWEANICINRKHIYLGSFPSEELAHAAYCKAAKKYHGEYARLE